VDDRHRPTLDMDMEEVIQFQKELNIKTGLKTLSGESDIVSLCFDHRSECLGLKWCFGIKVKIDFIKFQKIMDWAFGTKDNNNNFNFQSFHLKFWFPLNLPGLRQVIKVFWRLVTQGVTALSPWKNLVPRLRKKMEYKKTESDKITMVHLLKCQKIKTVEIKKLLSLPFSFPFRVLDM
jgi:hypothetical protein